MASATTEPVVDTSPHSGNDNPLSSSSAALITEDEDHPDGAAIRRQVEFYFSDENLPTDLHLLKCCGGRENIPVSISLVCGFKKMRLYKPKRLVIAALRRSTFLEVVENGKKIRRRMAMQGRCALDPDFFEENDDIAHDPRTLQPAVFPVPLLPQSRKEHAEGISKNMLKPTGFEKTYTEPMPTPKEAEEEDAMYDPEKSIIERLEIAIQRFKQKRRMHEKYALVFNKLMRFGGVECSPRMYQGISKAELANMDAEEVARALAIHSIPWDRSDTKKWVVNFEGIAKAFLSSWYPTHYGMTLHVIQNACQVLRSFFKYLLYHTVCPEYTDDLVRARDICDTAEKELPKVVAAGLALPGDFNKAASVIFGGAHAGQYIGDQAWAKGLELEGVALGDIGIRAEEARVKFKSGIFIMGSDEQVDRLESDGFHVVSSEATGLEVTAIHPPDDNARTGAAEQTAVWERRLGRLEPLGKLICKTWFIDDCDEWDLPQDELRYPGGKPFRADDAKEYEFWIEESVLEACFVGMKLDASVLALDEGISILDDVKETSCSFFTWLPNELWMERKPKEVRWLKKGLGLDDDEEEANGENKENTDNEKSKDKSEDSDDE